jgi:hypothetical protein
MVLIAARLSGDADGYLDYRCRLDWAKKVAGL